MSNSNFSDDGLWAKIGKFAKKIGGDAVFMAICLWIVIKDSDAPLWAKSTATAALVYFISPVDAIPDFMPGGFADDLTAITAAFSMLAMYITDEVKLKARRKMPAWMTHS